MKKESREIIINAIKRLANKLNRFPYYFTNEEDIRCQLYHTIASHYKHKMKVKCINTKRVIITNSLHAEGTIIEKEKKHKIDILIHHTKSTVPAEIREGKIYFYYRFKGYKSVDRRTLIEVKVRKREKGRAEQQEDSIIDKIKKDFNKRKNIYFKKAYLIFVDRGNKLKSENAFEIIKKLTETDKRFTIVYLGCEGKGKKIKIYRFCNGNQNKI